MKSHDAQVRKNATQRCMAPDKGLLCHIVRFHGDAILFLFMLPVKYLGYIYQIKYKVDMAKSTVFKHII